MNIDPIRPLPQPLPASAWGREAARIAAHLDAAAALTNEISDDLWLAARQPE